MGELRRFGHLHRPAVARQRRGVVGGFAHLLVELLDARGAGTRHRLVGGHDHPPEARLAVERRQASIVVQLGLATMPLGVEGLGVDLRDHQRHVGVLPPRRRVVDNGRTRGGDLLGQLAGGAAAGGEQDDVETREISCRCLFDLDLTVGPRQLLARRPKRTPAARRWGTTARRAVAASRSPPAPPTTPTFAIYRPADISSAPPERGAPAPRLAVRARLALTMLQSIMHSPRRRRCCRRSRVRSSGEAPARRVRRRSRAPRSRSGSTRSRSSRC